MERIYEAFPYAKKFSKWLKLWLYIACENISKIDENFIDLEFYLEIKEVRKNFQIALFCTFLNKYALSFEILEILGKGNRKKYHIFIKISRENYFGTNFMENLNFIRFLIFTQFIRF